MDLSASSEQTYNRPDVPAQDAVIDPVWRAAVLTLSSAWILVLWLFWETVLSAVTTWHGSQTFSHGFLIPPITLYLVWRQRKQVTRLTPAPNWWGLPILAMVGLVWLVGNLASVLLVQQLAVVAMLQGLVWTILGWRVTHVLLFPLGFLFFAVPMGEILVRPLQDFTAFFTVKALELSGIPVLWEGWFIVIPSATWEVAEACSGTRYVIPSVILGCLFSYVTYRSWAKRLSFILLSFAVAVLANGIRAYGIVMVAHLTNNRLAVGIDHLVSGWIFFGIVVFSLFWIGLRWRDLADFDVSEVEMAATSRGGVGSTRKAMAFTAGCGVALLALAPVIARNSLDDPTVAVALRVWEPSVSQPWRDLDAYAGEWKPRFFGADGEMLKSYVAGQQHVHLFIAYYQARQKQGGELINSDNVLVDRKKWLQMAANSARVVVDGRSLSVEEAIIRSGDRTRLVWSWYWVDGQYTSNPYLAKLLEVKARLLGSQNGSAVIAIAADYNNGNRLEAANTIRNFLRHTSFGPALARWSTSAKRKAQGAKRQETGVME